MDCVVAQRHLDAYVDGELTPSATLELESHVAGCDVCTTHVDFAQRLKRTLRQQCAAEAAPPSLRQSVQQALLTGEASGDRRRRQGQMAGWATLASAAAVVVWFVTPSMNPFELVQTERVRAGQGVAASGQQASIFGDIVERHQEPDPVEIDTRELAGAERWFSGKLQFRVRPVAFQEPQVQLVGARLTRVGNRRAAKLYYAVGDRRMTAVAFEATPEFRGWLEARPDVRVVKLGDREIRYHQVHGYTVPIIEENGIVYGFTGDLDETNMLRIVASAQLR